MFPFVQRAPGAPASDDFPASGGGLRRGRAAASGGSRRAREAVLAAVLVGLPLGGCDIPTSLPEWNSVWEIPGDSLRMEMSSLLPAGIREEGDSIFVVRPPSFVVRAALADLCPPCAALGGIVLPKPAIQASFQDQGDLPADVLGLTLRSGSVDFRVSNDLGFDPLRPGGSARGSLRLVLRSHPDGRVLADTLLSGDDHALPPAGSLVLTVPLRPGAVGAQVVGEVHFDSPAGTPAPIRGTDAFQVEVIPGELLVSDARVDAGGRALSPTSMELGGGDIDQAILDRIEEGRLRLEVDNPFGVGADLTVRLEAPGETAVQRPLPVGPDGGNSVLDYTGDELRRFLGREGARWTVVGTVDPEAGAVLVRPGAAAVVRGTFLLTLSVGG